MEGQEPGDQADPEGKIREPYNSPWYIRRPGRLDLLAGQGPQKLWMKCGDVLFWERQRWQGPGWGATDTRGSWDGGLVLGPLLTNSLHLSLAP